MLELFHFLHIIGGVAFGGAALLSAWVEAPALQHMEPDARLAHNKVRDKYGLPFVLAAGIIVLIGGIGNAWMSGAITSFGDLFSGYGLMVTLAVVVFIAWGALDGMIRARMTKAIEAKDSVAFARQIWPSKIVTSLALLILLGLMGAMRLGLY